jgi:CheY-like chemotaxis protein
VFFSLPLLILKIQIMKILNWNNIFLADDDPEDCEIFAEALREVNSGAKLTASKNGHELMALLQKPPVPLPDVIFLDLNMPVKSGYQCMKEIRENPELKDHIVVIFTTSSLKEDIDRMYQLGANLYIVKPSDFERLKEILRTVFSGVWLDSMVQPQRNEFAVQ